MKWLVPKKPNAVQPQKTEVPEGMSDFRRRVAAFRTATGTPEQFVLSCACAKMDRPFLIVFERCDSSAPFRIGAIERAEPSSGKGEHISPRTLPATALNFSGFACPWCGDQHSVIACADCNTFVCGGRSLSWETQARFYCRSSCGAGNRPLTDLNEIQGADAPSRPGARTASRHPALPGATKPELLSPPAIGKLK